MDLSAYQEHAAGYYLIQSMPDNVADDWDRYICTDGQYCKEVEANYLPTPTDAVFSCRIHGGRTNVELWKTGEGVKA